MIPKTIQDLQQQLQLHGSKKFNEYYTVSSTTTIRHVGYSGANGILNRPDFPPNGLSVEERHKLFYEIVGQKDTKAKLMTNKQKQLDKLKKIVEGIEEVKSPEYTGPWSKFMHRF